VPRLSNVKQALAVFSNQERISSIWERNQNARSHAGMGSVAATFSKGHAVIESKAVLSFLFCNSIRILYRLQLGYGGD
jgi:hypothetical protein